ncbi:flagellar hook-length control protein FliK [Pseudoalteromonas luteoviolacea]|uniref:flagellar hook-length control protein FliK n=1 Tax=Pseudoalteromonas luteoviolacea TaxID=43657 RepID=UPI001154B814|nr:flagellar hook-length control protein FliK [Pseudoalteromonas luteoviolacea]TQF69938.1 hypothetical protein FLM44_02270 [Pseudoalteromonas luteoviolacea]
MVNVSLEVGLNNTVSPQHRQAEDSADGRGFMAVLAEATEREESNASAQNEADREEQVKQEASSEKSHAEKTRAEQERAEQTGQANQKPIPKELDEPLKLDESHLPKPKQGPDVILKVATSEDVNKSAPTPSADSLLSQINASNNQKTGVEHHLAPVPQALKAHLGNAEKVEEVPTKSSKKGPIDLIGPIVVQDNKDSESAIKTAPKLMAMEESSSSKQGQGQAEVLKPSPVGPRQSEGPVGDPSDEPAAGANSSKLLENGGKVQSQPEAFDGVKKEREWYLHDNKAAKSTPTTDSVNVVKVAPQPTDNKSVPNADVAKGTGSERKVPDLISDLMQKESINPVQGQEKPVAKETDKLTSLSKEFTDKVTSASAQSGQQAQATDAPKHVLKQTSAEPTVTPKIAEGSNSKLSELKAMVDNLSPEEKQELEKLVNERLSDAKPADSATKKQEAALYNALTGKSLNQSSESSAAAVTKGSMDSEAKDKVGLSNEKLGTDKPENSAKTDTSVKSEFTYNSTKVAAKEQPATEVSKQGATEVSATTEEQAELPSNFEGEQQNGSQNQRQTASQNVENVFKAIRTLGTEQIQSKEEFEQVIQQVEQSRQNQQTTVQQSNAQAKLQMDPGVAQALNLTRNDAAKMLQDKVNMMINLNNKEAEIRLDPAELGSMQIRIRSDAEQAQINFVVQNQQAKELLEESMPKLREMLEEQGIELGESNIQQESEGSSSGDENEQQGHGKLANEASEAQNNKEQSVTSRKQSDSAIDYYA